MHRSRRGRTLALLLLGGALALPLLNPVARACGAFFHVRTIAPEQRPSLAREKVLIIHDAVRGQQHFIREVAFRKADQTFGFVVPTPTRPEVAEVATNPFTKLRERFPFAPQPRATLGVGRPYGGGGSWEGVEVLSAEKIGSFTAFVLAATDAKALSGWLKENELTSTPETEAWLDHYVRMGFYYVAMRYDPPAKAQPEAESGVSAETIRISFATPVAYYPYFEPQRSAATSSQPRLLELWYVGSEPVIPVARKQDNAGSTAWVSPLKPGEEYTKRRKQIEAALDDELEQLLPAGELVVQTFQDQKRRRDGYHDILFAFDQPKQLTAEQLAALEPLLGVLDPGLIEERR